MASEEPQEKVQLSEAAEDKALSSERDWSEKPLLILAKDEFDITHKDDPGRCLITGCCRAGSDCYVLADRGNNCLKLLNSKFDTIAYYRLAGKPYDVRQVTYTEIAVAIFYDYDHMYEIHFFDVEDGKIDLKRKVKLEHFCRSFAYHNGYLYCLSQDALYIYTPTGQLQKKIDGDLNSAVFNKDGDIIYALKNDLLLLVDEQLKPLKAFRDDELVGPSSVAIGAYGTIFVCGSSSNTVIEVDKDGERKLSTLATKQDGIDHPLSLCFDRRNSQIIVGQFKNSIVVLRGTYIYT